MNRPAELDAERLRIARDDEPGALAVRLDPEQLLDLKRHIVQAHEAAGGAMRDAVEHAVRAGLLLLDAKAKVAHGEFAAFCCTLPFAATTARGYMRLARLDPTNRQRVADLPLRDALAQIAGPGESDPVPHVANNSGNNEWYTPPAFIAAARDVMGRIDCDPASSEAANATVQAARYFDAEADGLTRDWSGRVWMNPPYAQPLIARFCDALAEKFAAGEVEQACVLMNNATETGWFQALLEHAAAVCLIKSRVRFLNPDGNPGSAPLQGQAVVYLGTATRRFADAFCGFGTVLFGPRATP